VRRFFIFDTVSGIKGAGAYLNKTTNTTAIRWVSTAKLVIELDPNNEEQIYVPYLELDYHTLMTSTLKTVSTTTVAFETLYTTNTDTFWIVILVIFIIINIIAVLLTVWKLYSWCVLYPIDGSGAGAVFYGILRLVFFIVESWTTLIFWFLFGACFYWFVFFKL